MGYRYDTATGINVFELPGAAETMYRDQFQATSVATIVSGRVHFNYFQVPTVRTITKILTYTGGTAAAATPTMCRAGFYTVASNGDLTLACAIANDTALWAGTFTEYERNLSSGGSLPTTYQFFPGQWYAGAVICVNVGAVPTFYGNNAGASTPWARTPRLTAALNAQTDLPTSVPSGSLSTSGSRMWLAGLP